MSRRLTLSPLICLGIGLVPQVSAAATDVVAPVTAVTVYSDRARCCERRGRAAGTGTRVELPLLPAGVDASSIRVELDATAAPTPKCRASRLVCAAQRGQAPVARSGKTAGGIGIAGRPACAAGGRTERICGAASLDWTTLPSANGLGQPTGTFNRVTAAAAQSARLGRGDGLDGAAL